MQLEEEEEIKTKDMASTSIFLISKANQIIRFDDVAAQHFKGVFQQFSAFLA